MSAGRATTHWDNFRSLATDASNEYDIMLCVYDPSTYSWLQLKEPSRQVAYAVSTCCVELVY